MVDLSMRQRTHLRTVTYLLVALLVAFAFAATFPRTSGAATIGDEAGGRTIADSAFDDERGAGGFSASLRPGGYLAGPGEGLRDIQYPQELAPALAPSSLENGGMSDQQFLEQSTIAAKSSAYDQEQSASDRHPITGLPLYGTDLRPGLQSTETQQEALSDRQFLEQSTIAAKSTAYDSGASVAARHPLTGLPLFLTDLQAGAQATGESREVLSDHQFLELNTIAAKSTAYESGTDIAWSRKGPR